MTHAVGNGDVAVWRAFVERYSGLIFHVIRQHLPGEEEDELRCVYVDILEDLYKGTLSKYRGSVSLAAWLTVVVRRRALDVLRSRYGRIRPPKGLDGLADFDRLIFQLHHVERLKMNTIVALLPWYGHDSTAEEIVEAIIRIEDAIDPRCLRRLDETHAARRHGATDRQVLRYVVDARVRWEQYTTRNTPDRHLLEKEADQIAERIRNLVRQLPMQEQRVIELRFEKGLRAREISEALGFGGQRKVYTIIERVVRRMRSALNGNGTNAGQTQESRRTSN